MSSRNAKWMITALMLGSLLVISLSMAGILPSVSGQAESSGSQPAASSSSGTTAAQTTGSTAKPTPTVSLKPLPIESVNPEPTPALGMRRWPAASSIPDVHRADLSAYNGKSAAAQPLEGITVILDAGHGGKDGGTSYPANSSKPEIVEKTVALKVANQTRSLLENLGATVVMTRTGDDWKSIYNRVAQTGSLILDRFARELPNSGFDSSRIDHLLPQMQEMIKINSDAADSGGRGLMKGVGTSADVRLLLDIENQYADVLFISIHCNAMGNGSEVGGLQIFHLTNESNLTQETNYAKNQASSVNPPAYRLYNDAGRLKLANLLFDSILGQVPELEDPGNSGILTGDYAVLREINLVSALVEMGFVTSPKDRQIMLSAEGQKKIAQGVANAILAYYCGDAGK